MISLHTGPKRPPHVLVEFGDGAHTFLLPQGATLAELADRICELTHLHEGAPIAIHVGYDMSNERLLRTTASHEPNHCH